MRKMLVVLAALLLVTASAQAAFTVSLVNQATGTDKIPAGNGTYTIDIMVGGTDMGTDGDGNPIGVTGGAGRVSSPANLVASGLVLDFVNFDSDLTSVNTTNPNVYFELGTFGKGPYFTPVRLASFTLTATDAVKGQLVDFLEPYVSTSDFGTNYDVAVTGLTVTPEPATALLLLGALPFLRRRHA